MEQSYVIYPSRLFGIRLLDDLVRIQTVSCRLYTVLDTLVARSIQIVECLGPDNRNI
jgi:hypothetical protein